MFHYSIKKTLGNDTSYINLMANSSKSNITTIDETYSPDCFIILFFYSLYPSNHHALWLYVKNIKTSNIYTKIVIVIIYFKTYGNQYYFFIFKWKKHD